MRWSVVLLALVVTAPTLYHALWVQDITVDSALIHFLIAVPIVAVLSAFVRMAMRPQSSSRRPSRSASGLDRDA